MRHGEIGDAFTKCLPSNFRRQFFAIGYTQAPCFVHEEQDVSFRRNACAPCILDDVCARFATLWIGNLPALATAISSGSASSNLRFEETSDPLKSAGRFCGFLFQRRLCPVRSCVMPDRRRVNRDGDGDRQFNLALDFNSKGKRPWSTPVVPPQLCIEIVCQIDSFHPRCEVVAETRCFNKYVQRL